MEGPLSAQDALDITKECVCGECGANLLNPWGGAYGIDGYVVRCYKEVDHVGVKVRGQRTRILRDPEKGLVEVDVQTQGIVKKDAPEFLAMPSDEQGMVARLNEALDIGLFPKKDVGPQQVANLAKMALLYKLDPLMREIMPYQGQPYITIEGRRRIDARSGNAPSISFRPMDKPTKEAYVDMGALDAGDIVVFATLTDPKTGQTVEAMGRVQNGEGLNLPNSQYLPIVKWRLEMAQKRAESRARKMMFGPVALPGGMDAMILEEGDVVEGQFREIDELTGEITGVLAPPRPAPPAPPQVPPEGPTTGTPRRQSVGRLGTCEEHGRVWARMPGGKIGHPTDVKDSPCYKPEDAPAEQTLATAEPDPYLDDENEPHGWDESTVPIPDGQAPAQADAVFDEEAEVSKDLVSLEWDTLCREMGDAGLTLDDVLGEGVTADQFKTMGGTATTARQRMVKVLRDRA